jgi:hypothetical protein
MFRRYQRELGWLGKVYDELTEAGIILREQRKRKGLQNPTPGMIAKNC